MDITLKQLEIFRAVVVSGSITKASRRIGLSQPSISQQLAKLEEKLGSPLIQRNRTGFIDLTPAGEYWFKTGDDLLRRLDGVVSEHRQRFIDGSVYVRMGVTPTLRGRFGAAAARIASESPGFVKFELRFALTSSELVEQLRLHQINYAIVNADAIDQDRNSFHIAEVFEDCIAWIVPTSVPLAAIKRALAERPTTGLEGPLARYVEIDANVSPRAKSDEWYRHHLPGAGPTFSANTYSMAVDMVAEGLATTHCPCSLLPNISAADRSRLRVIPLRNFSRTMVLAVPKHLTTLPAYAHLFRRIIDFCRTDYQREMYVEEGEEMEEAV